MFDHWHRATGDAGWSFDRLLPHFVRMEGNATFAGPLHGIDGPFKVSHLMGVHDLSHRSKLSAQDAGIPYSAEFNRGDQTGVGFLRVRGITGLRVLDAAAMPAFVSDNTNAATLALADRGVDLMMGPVVPAAERQLAMALA